ncbi:MAG: hypothetical protein LBK73_03610 [Treponema sp.]|jgi:hypothetical protein|nr:hypothetical protein [Treponema sp.]
MEKAVSSTAIVKEVRIASGASAFAQVYARGGAESVLGSEFRRGVPLGESCRKSRRYAALGGGRHAALIADDIQFKLKKRVLFYIETSDPL